MRAEAFDELGDLFEGGAEGKLGTGGVLDEDLEVAGGGEVDSVHGALDAFGSFGEAFVAGESAIAAGVQDEVFGAECETAFDFAAKGGDGFLPELVGLACEVDEVADVDNGGLDAVFAAERAHLVTLLGGEVEGLPHARTRAEDLEGVAAEAIGALRGGLDAASGGGVHTDLPSGTGGRGGLSGPEGEEVFFGAATAGGPPGGSFL